MRRAGGVAALGVVLCLLAAAFDVRSLYVPGVALCLVAASAVASVQLAGRLLQLTREPETASLEELAPLRLTLQPRGRLLRAAGGALSRWPGDTFSARRRMPRAPLHFEVRPQRRGVQVIGPSEVRFRDPFGICERTVRSPECRVLVLPRVERIDGEQLVGISGLARDARTRSGMTQGSDVDALRPYRPGAPASLIHWPTVARTGTLVERRLGNDSERRPLVVLDARGPASEEALDMAVRAAASLCFGLAKLGGCSLLLPGEHRAELLDRELGGWPAAHARLAMVRAGGAPAPAATAAAAILIRVSAGSAPPGMQTNAAADADYTVSPFPLRARPVLFSVAGCAVQAASRAIGARAA